MTIAAFGVMRVLKRGEYVSIGQPEVRMRVHVACHVCKRCRYLGIERVAHVENERPSGVVVVGKQHAAGRHGVFRMVRVHRLLIGDNSGQQVPVRGRRGVGVNHRQKVIPLFGDVTSPRKHVMTSRSLRLL